MTAGSIGLMLLGIAAGAAAAAFRARANPGRGRPVGRERDDSAPAEEGKVPPDSPARKDAEEELARLAMAVEQAGEAIVIADTDGSIRYVNPAFERITGYRREEALGKNPRILKSGRQPDAFYRQMWEILSGGGTWRGTFVNRRKDGTLFEEEAVISPVRDAAGRIVNYVAVKKDVTEERQREEQLRRVQRMEAVTKLAGGIAHDFNNLLTAVIGYADLLVLQLPESDPHRRHAEEIKRAGTRAAELTRQLLAFSRQQVLQPRDLSMNDLIGGLEATLRDRLGGAIALSFLHAEGLGKVHADPDQIEQALLHLAARAKEVMPGGGKLVVETANVVLDDAYARQNLFVRPGAYVMVAVSDTGPAMDAEAQALLFEPFSAAAGPGKGLGLSSVYGIVKQSDGYIRVQSEPGGGTTFQIFLPRADRAAAGAPPVPPARLRGSETILVVEDEELVLDLVREILTDYGYSVLTAAHGEEGLRVLSSHPGPIHLLLTDVVLPMMGGTDLADRAEALRPETRVLFMSGHTEDTVIRHGVPGVDGLLQKPFHPESVARKVREVLDAPRAA
jgi:PAS domain S-box-containing protein